MICYKFITYHYLINIINFSYEIIYIRVYKKYLATKIKKILNFFSKNLKLILLKKYYLCSIFIINLHFFTLKKVLSILLYFYYS